MACQRSRRLKTAGRGSAAPPPPAAEQQGTTQAVQGRPGEAGDGKPPPLASGLERRAGHVSAATPPLPSTSLPGGLTWTGQALVGAWALRPGQPRLALGWEAQPPLWASFHEIPGGAAVGRLPKYWSRGTVSVPASEAHGQRSPPPRNPAPRRPQHRPPAGPAPGAPPRGFCLPCRSRAGVVAPPARTPPSEASSGGGTFPLRARSRLRFPPQRAGSGASSAMHGGGGQGRAGRARGDPSRAGTRTRFAASQQEEPKGFAPLICSGCPGPLERRQRRGRCSQASPRSPEGGRLVPAARAALPVRGEGGLPCCCEPPRELGLGLPRLAPPLESGGLESARVPEPCHGGGGRTEQGPGSPRRGAALSPEMGRGGPAGSPLPPSGQRPCPPPPRLHAAPPPSRRPGLSGELPARQSGTPHRGSVAPRAAGTHPPPSASPSVWPATARRPPPAAAFIAAPAAPARGGDRPAGRAGRQRRGALGAAPFGSPRSIRSGVGRPPRSGRFEPLGLRPPGLPPAGPAPSPAAPGSGGAPSGASGALRDVQMTPSEGRESGTPSRRGREPKGMRRNRRPVLQADAGVARARSRGRGTRGFRRARAGPERGRCEWLAGEHESFAGDGEGYSPGVTADHAPWPSDACAERGGRGAAGACALLAAGPGYKMAAAAARVRRPRDGGGGRGGTPTPLRAPATRPGDTGDAIPGDTAPLIQQTPGTGKPTGTGCEIA
uniref:collagen alpha-1(I) chain-like n=1 Tax=Euleptes europaea TaxID=460621 RepID=UPI0025423111|nr:collagen alpha-1(I) chain-like [Euleptes europaea]